MKAYLLVLLLLGFLLNDIQSYPSSCTCNSLMQVGSIMMGGATYLDSTYQIAVSKSEVSLLSGDTVSTGDILSVTVTPNIASSVQYVIESTSGTFTDSYVMSPVCKYSRTMNEIGSPLTHTLVLTTSGSAAITVTWMNADAACAISSPFNLVIGGNSSNVTIPTATVSTSQGTQKRLDTTLGIVLGIGGVMCLLAFFKFKDQGVAFFTNANLCAVAAVALTLINFALVISWATDGSTAMKGFLSTPSWTDNPFPFHPIFMVTLTLNFQIFRFIFSDFLSNKSLGLYNDVLMIITLMGVIIGIAAVGSYKNPSPNDTTSLHRPNLTTMHSWIGFGAAVLIGVCVLWFLLLRLCQDCAPVVYKGLVQQFNFMFIHLPMAAFFFTSLAVGTGISDQLNQSACVPKVTPTPDYADIQTPVYSDIPEACKYANGLGISVVFSTIATVCMIRYRARDIQQTGVSVSSRKPKTINDTTNTSVVNHTQAARRNNPQQQQSPQQPPVKPKRSSTVNTEVDRFTTPVNYSNSTQTLTQNRPTSSPPPRTPSANNNNRNNNISLTQTNGGTSSSNNRAMQQQHETRRSNHFAALGGVYNINRNSSESPLSSPRNTPHSQRSFNRSSTTTSSSNINNSSSNVVRLNVE